MAAPAQQTRQNEPKRQSDKSTAEVMSELWRLVKDYAKQETVDPLKRLLRFVAFGAPGSILLGLGVVLLSLGALRAMQTQTGRHLTGSLNWVPYLVTFVIAAILVALALRAIGKTSKGKDDKSKDAKESR